ncbi:CDP-glycerol glycerophosphotransferase family protein [Microbacterium luticocti]|uniref:CDP-glycerol glycerophosphotransferase family protein n=1 Tax=Microbacterium luticocti TaxID=451764 RepID=UPI000414F36F|nr:CDP-glycerol glycerophosphotransferase family protein [Microbacterium luticocti]
MASFSFGAGNAAKLLRIPLYAAGRLATLVIPRTADEWVFGCGVGIGDGALAMWDEVAAHGHRAVWLVSDERAARDAAARGIPTVRTGSLRGFWRTARARVAVVTHGFGDVNRYAIAGAFIVQLWHGIPLKRIGIDSPETVQLPGPMRRMPPAALLRRLLAVAYRRTTRQIDLIPAASHLVRGRLESAFSLPDRCVPVTGEPRVDVLSRGDAATRRHRARHRIEQVVGEVGDRRLVLYAPTWRDGEADPAVPDPDEWRRIVAVLERHDAVLLVRSHPLGAGGYTPPVATTRVRALGSDRVVDATPLLSGIDVLVTDYSSMAFDAALVPVPVVWFAPDLESYLARRGMYGTYAEVAGSDWATDWAGTLRQLDAVLGDDAERAMRVRQAAALGAHVHAYADGCNTQRVYQAVQARLTGDRTRRDATGRTRRGATARARRDAAGRARRDAAGRARRDAAGRARRDAAGRARRGGRG